MTLARRVLGTRAVTRFLCHLVPACALVLAPGCFAGHGRDGADPARDAGPRPPDGDAGTDPPPPIIDAGRMPDPRPDPPPEPPPTMCPLARADATCMSSFLVAPGFPFELPIAFDECGCCPGTECTVAVDHATRRVHLSTALCPDPCDCAACLPVTGSCSIPALAAGLWTVEVNGDEAFVLPVETPPFVEPPPACVTYAQPDACRPSDSLEGEPVVPDEVCVSTALSGTSIELIEDCPSCYFLDGPCAVTLEPRLTDDLPPGGELHVAATDFVTGCDVACTAECTQTMRTCRAPPLVDGHFYRVWVNDRVVTSFTAGAGTRTCSR